MRKNNDDREKIATRAASFPDLVFEKRILERKYEFFLLAPTSFKKKEVKKFHYFNKKLVDIFLDRTLTDID